MREPHQQPEARVRETVWQREGEAVDKTRLSTLLLPPLSHASTEHCVAKQWVHDRARTSCSIRNVCFTFLLCLHRDHTTQQSHISQGTARWEGQTVVSKLIQPVATTCFTKHYLMSAFQRAVDLLFDHCCFKRKVFSFCGIGGLSLLLGSQYNYQRLQAALLPGIERLSQGYYYFHAELFGSQTQHLNNLVYEA